MWSSSSTTKPSVSSVRQIVDTINRRETPNSISLSDCQRSARSLSFVSYRTRASLCTCVSFAFWNIYLRLNTFATFALNVSCLPLISCACAVRWFRAPFQCKCTVFQVHLWSAGIANRASNFEACTRNGVKCAHLLGFWPVLQEARCFHVLRILTCTVPLCNTQWQFHSATTNLLILENNVTPVPYTPLLHRAVVIWPVWYSMAIMWILRAVPSAIKHPRTRSTTARQVSNAHERDLVTNQKV